jgi:proteasome component ECM29
MFDEDCNTYTLRVDLYTHTQARAARAIQAMAEDRTESLLPHTTLLADALLAELPGRLWDNKESLLHALGALALTCKAKDKSPAAALADPAKVRAVAWV